MASLSDRPQTPISGRTRLYGIVGDPIAQVGSPGLFNAMFQAQGIDAVMVAYHVAPDDLDEWWRGMSALRNLDGMIVTIPHKPAMSRLADRLGERGQEAGTINALKRDPEGGWIGDMMDGVACVQRLIDDARKLEGQRVLMVGTGGVGRAIAFALAHERIAALELFDVDDARMHGLSADLQSSFPDLEVTLGEPRAYDHTIVINCTPLGMRADDPMPIDPKTLNGDILAIDLVLEPEITQFLAAARALGCATLNGRAIVESNFGAIARFFGFDPDAATVTA